MKNLPVSIQNKNLTIRHPERVKELEARFENIINIVDTSDKLLALRELQEDLPVFYHDARDALKNSFGHKFTIGGAVILGVGLPVGMFLSGGMLLPATLGYGLLLTTAGGLLGDVTREMVWRSLWERSGDQAYHDALKGKVIKALDDIQDKADVRQIAQSPQAERVFERFPRLGKKFELACRVDAMREGAAGRGIGVAIDKTKPEL